MRLVRLLLFLTLSAPFVMSQQTVTKDPTAVAIAQNAIAAMGGTALLSYQDSTAHGTVTIRSSGTAQTFPVVLQSKGKFAIRQEIQKPNGTDTSVSDGMSACLKRPGRSPYLMDTVNLHAQRVDHIPILSLLSEYDRAEMNVRYAGSEIVNGQAVDVIALSFVPAQAPREVDALTVTEHLFYVDRSTGMVSKVRFALFSDGDRDAVLRVEMLFSDYRLMQGLAVPFLRASFIDGRHASDLTLTSVVFNTGLADSLFDGTCGVQNGQ